MYLQSLILVCFCSVSSSRRPTNVLERKACLISDRVSEAGDRERLAELEVEYVHRVGLACVELEMSGAEDGFVAWSARSTAETIDACACRALTYVTSFVVFLGEVHE